MIYLYAHTNFKGDLDNLRRVAAIYWNLQEQGIEAEILLNEFRAQLLAREWGLPLATTVETIKDIDAVATINDIIVIDSPEPLDGKVLNYPEKFKKVIYINSSCQDIEFKDAEVLNLFKDGILYTKLEKREKIDKTIFIFGDSDYNKIILKNLDYFKNKNLDLYWGEYFFVKYEEQLSKVFAKIVEGEEYYSAISEYKNIITSSLQVAVDGYTNGSNVAFLANLKENPCENILIDTLKIKKYDNIESITFDDKSSYDNINFTDLNYQINAIINSNM